MNCNLKVCTISLQRCFYEANMLKSAQFGPLWGYLMPKPYDAYRDGYNKGRKASLGTGLAEATLGMLRDDPGGYYAAGYRDGVAGKKFEPPRETAGKPAAARKAGRSSLTDLEREWYHLCDSTDFIPQYLVDYYVPTLNAQGSQVAVVIGLHNLTAHTCPKCGDKGQFKIHFLGQLAHSDCQWTGYMGTGSYIGFQLSQIFHSGIRAGGAVKDEADKKEPAKGNWIYGLLVFLFVAIFRACLAVVLIPLHTLVALFQPGQTRADIVKRVITFCVVLAALGVGVYEIQQATGPQSQQVRPAGAAQPNQAGPKTFRDLILGTWYPYATFIPHAGASVWDFSQTARPSNIPTSTQTLTSPPAASGRKRSQTRGRPIQLMPAP